MTEKAEYQVIARKWRPKKFAEVVGQDHIIRTLQNELLQQRTAHAYLFVGPRGIGKTTIARIFAKALNCQSAPSQEPCCKCQSCTAIADGSSLDVIEIDAASNNSVENARNLCEEVMYSPVNSRYKVYIIDEVHMLSTQAWNALLKTVEEPPAHVKFLFATTEAHKVLPTIVSRCQRFDLRRISTKIIADTLAKIAEVEKVKISRGAIDAVARAADGGMRDGQSLLDQMISFFSSGSDEISEENVLAIFGLTSESDMEKLISAILNDDKSAVITSIHSIATQGKNLEKLFEDVLTSLRGIQICKTVPNPMEILETDDETVASLKKSGEGIDVAKIQRMLESLSTASRLLHDALNKQVFLETIILKGMRISHAVPIEDLIRRLNSLQPGELSSASSQNYSPAEKKSPDLTVQPQPPIPKAPQPPREEIKKTEPIRTSEPAKPAPKPVPPQEHEDKSQSSAEFSPEGLWHKIILEMDHFNKPMLKMNMQEGVPEKWENGVLTIVYDQEFEELHVATLKKEIQTLTNCLHRVTGRRNSSIKIEVRKGIASPSETHHRDQKDMAEVRKRVQENKFVQEIKDLFGGEVVDVRG